MIFKTIIVHVSYFFFWRIKATHEERESLRLWLCATVTTKTHPYITKIHAYMHTKSYKPTLRLRIRIRIIKQRRREEKKTRRIYTSSVDGISVAMKQLNISFRSHSIPIWMADSLFVYLFVCANIYVCVRVSTFPFIHANFPFIHAERGKDRQFCRSQALSFNRYRYILHVIHFSDE